MGKRSNVATNNTMRNSLWRLLLRMRGNCMMTRENFAKTYSGSPLEEYALACLIQRKIAKDDSLWVAAKAYTDATDNLYSELDAAGIELG